MNWYAAHIVMIVRLKEQTQQRVPGWENVVLVRAANEQRALSKAEAIGRAGEGDDDDTFTWGGKRARWEFAGVRKITACEVATHQPTSGDEVTYNELEFESLRDANRYATGGAVKVRHVDQVRVTDDPQIAAPETRGRKRA